MPLTDPKVEITGVWLPNKGAELMAHATVSALSARLPGVTFYSSDQGPVQARRDIGMEPSLDFGFPYRKVRKLKLNFVDDRALLMSRRRAGITHVIDISGFAYGDFWGKQKARARAGRYLRAGLPIYMMPQAFGPFQDAALQAEMAWIVPRARLLAARDPVSKQHLDDLDTGREIPVVPDITLGLDVTETPAPVPEGRFGAIVLNAKLIKTGAMTEAEILDLFPKVAQIMRARGITPLIVLHEPEADLALSKRVAAAENVDILKLDDARAVKRVIGSAVVSVTARFHGLANSLSQAVPSFAVSWSHKYAQLLQEFGCDDAVFDGDTEGFLARFAAFLDSPVEIDARTKMLTAHAKEQKAAIAAFWDLVVDDMQQSG